MLAGRLSRARNRHGDRSIPSRVYDAIERVREWYWADPERHRVGRLDLAAARREVVSTWP